MNSINTKSVFAAVLFAAFTFVAGGDTHVWTGAAGDGKWSSSGNWDTQTTPENGDELRVSGEYGSEMENDIDALSVSRIVFTGDDPVRLTGNELTVANTSSAVVWTNLCPLVCDVPLKFTTGGSIWNQYVIIAAETVFNGEINAPSSRTLNLHSMYVQSTSYDVYFNAPLTGKRFSILPSGGSFHLNETVTADEYITSSSYSDKGGGRTVYFHKPFSYGNYLNMSFKVFCPMAANLLDPDGEIRFSGWRDSGVLDLNGFDQTVNFVAGEYLYNGKTPPKNDNDRCIRSAGPATLTMNATQSAETPAVVTGAVTLKYSPESSDLVQSFSYRTNTTTGAILVENGTFRIAKGAMFSNTPFIYVGPSATLEIDAENGVDDPFPALRVIEIATGGRLRIPAGVALTSAQVVHGGGLMEDGVTLTDDTGWIEGEGTLTPSLASLDGSCNLWNTLSGEWGTAANWAVGTPSTSVPSAIYGLHGRDVSVSVSAAAAPSADLTVASEGAGKAKLQVNALLPFVDANLVFGKGAQVEIGDGGELSSEVTQATGSNLTKWFSLAGGGTVDVKDGGRLSFTDIPGQVRIGSGSAVVTDELKIAAGGEVSMVQGQEDAVIEVIEGGRVDLKGDLSVARRYKNNASQIFVLNGGTLDASGSGTFTVTEGPDESGGGAINFHHGDITFSDDSMIRYTLAGSWASSLSFGSVSAEAPLHAKFEGNACISNFFGHLYISGPRGNGTVLDMSSVSDGFIGSADGNSFYDVFVGYKGGDAEFLFGGSGFNASLYGVFIGCATETSPDRYGTGKLVLMDGAKCESGASAAISRSNVNSAVPIAKFYGTVVGMWLNASDTLEEGARPEKGVFRMKGSTTEYRTLSGHFVIGAGCAEGLYMQEDGTNIVVVSNWSAENGQGEDKVRAYTTNNVLAIGMLGGKGECVISNGLFKSNVRTFVGGCHTNEYFDGAYFSYGRNEYTAGLRDAEGALRVFGGRFECAKTVFVGTDGDGLVEIGPAAEFTAETLVLSNSTASAIRFTFGENGFAADASVDRLVVADGAELVVDLSAVTDSGSLRLSYPLLRFGEAEGWFAEENIVISGVSASDSRLLRASVVRRGDGVYLVAPKTGLHITVR